MSVSEGIEASAAPIVKWAGGKRRLLKALLSRLPRDVDQRRHVELFAGGAALFFARMPERAWLSDTCAPLIQLYREVQDRPVAVLRSLRARSRKSSEAYYYRLRDWFNAGNGTSVSRASAFLYLNRAGFNGLYRCNQRGHFNVPYGHVDADSIYRPVRPLVCSAAPVLRRARLSVGDVHSVAHRVRASDFVYLDPPYAGLGGDVPSFVGYGAAGFDLEDQVRLQDLAERLAERGAAVMVSNSDTPFVRELWRRWRIDSVRAPRSVAADPGRRGSVGEVLIRSYGDA